MVNLMGTFIVLGTNKVEKKEHSGAKGKYTIINDAFLVLEEHVPQLTHICHACVLWPHFLHPLYNPAPRVFAM